MSSQAIRTGVQIVLALIIVGLAYFLYLSITEPYESVLRQERLTEETHQRMDDIRQALRAYERETDRFPGTLDSLVAYIDTSLMQSADSLFGEGFSLDSLIYTPRGGERFLYSVNDTAAVDIYLLEDPVTGDLIGSEQPDPTKLHAASWE